MTQVPPERLQTAPGTDWAPGLERAFALEPRDGTAALGPRPAAVPDWLQGTAYWNGPARFARGPLRYRHWLDGDGMVLAVHLGSDGAGIRTTHRFVRSHKLRAEEASGAALYRAFGTAFGGDRLERVGIASPVNVSVYPWSGTLLALGEQGLPWELDPETLETRGEWNFGGALNAISPWSAHPAIDCESRELFGFGISFAGSEPCIHLYRFAPGRGERPPHQVFRRRLPLPYPCTIHDFGLSGRFAIFHLAPYLLDAAAILRDGRTVMESLSWRPERGSFLLVADRETGAEVARLKVGRGYCLHHVNAFEDETPGGSQRLCVDILELDRPVYDQYEVVPDLFTDVARGRPVRYAIDLGDPRGARVSNREEITYDRAPDFPVVLPSHAGKPTTNLWALGISATGKPGRKFFDELLHLRWDRPEAADLWRCPPGCYLAGEPVLVEGPDGAACALTLLFDAERPATRFLVFDAHRVGAGPLAELPLPEPLPALFHGSFAPSPA